MDNFPLAIVTGAAHRLGRAFALKLARLGYAVILHYNQSTEKAVTTANEISAIGVPVFQLEADLTNSDQIQSIFSKIDSLDYTLKVLINSAAGMKHADLRSISIAEWDFALGLNLRAPLFLAQHAAKRMVEGGCIVNVTDSGVGKTWTGFPAYMVSKTGLEMLTRLQAKTYAPSIRVNAIAPGLVLPAMNILQDDWDSLVNKLPLRHAASPDEITDALEFLLKNESVTGQTIVVDGGYSLL
jgi:pteridine reductase